MNISQSLERHAFINGERTAVKFKGKTYSYKQVNQNVDAFAQLLTSLNVKQGDRVAIWLPNSMEFIYAFYAALKIGAIAVPINHLFKSAEANYILKDSGAKIIFTTNEKIPMLENNLPNLNKVIITDHFQTDSEQFIDLKSILTNYNGLFCSKDLSPDQGACILYTSGTTGNPKGVELSHYNLNTNAEFYADSINLTENHYGCIVTPLSHLLVLMAGLILIFMKGGKFYLFEKFSPKTVASKICEEKINFFIGVPAMYYMFLTLPDAPCFDMSSLELCITSGGHMPLEVRKKFESRYNTKTIQAYGQTESSPVITVDMLSRERRFESVGYPIPHLEVAIVDDKNHFLPPHEPGEIIVRGHCVMKGYWNNPEQTDKTIINGWLHTGDIGKMDEDGYVYLLDRKKDLIIVGGYNVYPVEIENVLYTHPAILESAVIGQPDERLGEIPKAFVVLKEGVSVSKEEIIQFCLERLAKYKQIREVEFIKEIPKTPSGKLMKRGLKAQYN
ncbi:long-chain fatty acid--CoA ligase [Paenibacillus sp. BSR1-1]|uniref:class I adenylate-forming enzyme family protein n=1 Tax=Paenibacillus sp. BSR1-1 TaxID=3020845 RepID=UPI0025B0BE2A|nr:long-chain fatty acid--CoA ligase [Paenibacillus sp. BSR1-1]MDN3016186.1 long-chain fatty acid--CoA ligase [Paenibacillus sp. BSR1-1]